LRVTGYDGQQMAATLGFIYHGKKADGQMAMTPVAYQAAGIVVGDTQFVLKPEKELMPASASKVGYVLTSLEGNFNADASEMSGSMPECGANGSFDLHKFTSAR
jgi:hypothetical protein